MLQVISIDNATVPLAAMSATEGDGFLVTGEGQILGGGRVIKNLADAEVFEVGDCWQLSDLKVQHWLQWVTGDEAAAEMVVVPVGVMEAVEDTLERMQRSGEQALDVQQGRYQGASEAYNNVTQGLQGLVQQMSGMMAQASAARRPKGAEDGLPPGAQPPGAPPPKANRKTRRRRGQ